DWTAIKAAFSMSAIIEGVENTPTPPEPTLLASTEPSTVSTSSPTRPGSSMGDHVGEGRSNLLSEQPHPLLIFAGRPWSEVDPEAVDADVAMACEGVQDLVDRAAERRARPGRHFETDSGAEAHP